MIPPMMAPCITLISETQKNIQENWNNIDVKFIFFYEKNMDNNISTKDELLLLLASE